MLRPPVGGRDHIRGNPRAPLQLVEYGDFECPFCGRASGILRSLEESLDDNLCLAFRHFPLSHQHPHALMAAQAAEAAGAQQAFWAMHDLLFESQSALDLDDLLGYAYALGLDLDAFARHMQSSNNTERIRADIHSGTVSGVHGTPTLFLNGLRYNGPIEFDALREVLMGGGLSTEG